MGGNGRLIDRGLNTNISPWWQSTEMLPCYTQPGFFPGGVVLFFSPALVLLERTPMACCHLNFLYPVIIHWIHSSLLWNTQHSSCWQSKHIFFWAITTVLGAWNKPVGKNIHSILCILDALATNNVKIELKVAWTINTCCLTKQEVWG